MERKLSIIVRVAIILIALYATATGIATARADKLIANVGIDRSVGFVDMRHGKLDTIYLPKIETVLALRTSPNLEAVYQYAQWIYMHGMYDKRKTFKERYAIILKSLELFETIKKEAPGYLEIDRELNRSKKAINNVRSKKLTDK